MMIKWFVIYFCAIAYFLTGVDAKICERYESVTRMVQVTYSTAYITTYLGQCDFACIRTRWATSVNHRYVPKLERKTIKYCCSGYIRTDDSSNDSEIVCEPICMPACKNGHCTAPGECACNAGYDPDPEDSHNCSPSCAKPCDHGACVAPDTCQCDFGYTLVNTTCQPVCTEPCHNGTCIAPETCECLSGFRKSEKNVCEPYCSNGCDNGFCIAPETCRCNTGWYIPYVLNNRCEPLCSEPCYNGICVAPETCVCKPSYRKSKSGICEAQCSPPCGNGTCIAPQKCSCLPGYQINTEIKLLPDSHSPVCIPTCALCKDEDCVAPNQCLPVEINKPTHKLLDKGNYYSEYDEIYDDYYSDLFLNSHSETKKRLTNKSTLNEINTESINSHSSTSPDDTKTDTTVLYVPSTTDDLNTTLIKNVTSSKSTTYTFLASTRSYDTTTVAGSIKNLNNTSTPSDDTINTASRKSMPWLQQHWVSILIPVLVIVSAAVIMLLVWRWAPIVIFFKGRSYVVQGDPVERNGHRSFEDIQISAINEKEKTAKN